MCLKRMSSSPLPPTREFHTQRQRRERERERERQRERAHTVWVSSIFVCELLLLLFDFDVWGCVCFVNVRFVQSSAEFVTGNTRLIRLERKKLCCRYFVFLLFSCQLQTTTINKKIKVKINYPIGNINNNISSKKNQNFQVN